MVALILSAIVAYFVRSIFWDDYPTMAATLGFFRIDLPEEHYVAASWIATIAVFGIARILLHRRR